MHAIQQLYEKRKAQSTRPFNARGKKVNRCQLCLVAKKNCICEFRKTLPINAAFLLLMYDDEVLKPSNTGKLIADVVADTYGFIWSRTEPDKALLALLEDERYQPVVIFPQQYAVENQPMLARSELSDAKIPLFVLLDASWREAKKMYRKSPYLHQLPMMSFDFGDDYRKQYQLRNSINDAQFSTAEVAAFALNDIGQQQAATQLKLWLEVFSFFYQKSVKRENKGDENALAHYLDFIKQGSNDTDKK
ncbi:tRNA-uridine aminocarboxypropyltransferase [Thalassotalea agarivorans]|nr:DTW domain-containing protein [Thalassotalea agarivorans]